MKKVIHYSFPLIIHFRQLFQLSMHKLQSLAWHDRRCEFEREIRIVHTTKMLFVNTIPSFFIFFKMFVAKKSLAQQHIFTWQPSQVQIDVTLALFEYLVGMSPVLSSITLVLNKNTLEAIYHDKCVNSVHPKLVSPKGIAHKVTLLK